MSPRSTSIASLVTLGLVSVATVVLTSVGLIAYASYERDHWRDLHVRHATLADQLAIGLASPLWNFDRPTLAKIADGGLRDPMISGLVVRLADDGSLIDVRTRDRAWHSVAAERLPDSGGSLARSFAGSIVEQRRIVFDGETIGSVKLWATTRFVEDDLRKTRVTMIAAIVIFDALLILFLYGLLRRLVLTPLRAVGRYALAVSSGEPTARPSSPVGLRGELSSLQAALSRMLEQLDARNATLEERVAERTSQLAISNKELQSFSYSVSHDLRSPLRSIDGWSHALLEDCGPMLDERGRGYLAKVRGEAQRMGQLIDDLLRFAKVTQAELQIQMVDVSTLAAEHVARLRQREPSRQVECTIEPGLRVEADAGLLESALANLLDNAWKFTRGREPARVTLGSTLEQGVRVLFVRDNGVGFDMASAGKLFMPFQRLHRAKDFPGTGVGLATVQRIVQRHGGRIWAESQVGQGTSFFFTLQSAA